MVTPPSFNKIKFNLPFLDQFPETKPYSETQINMDSIRGQNEPGTEYEQ